VSLRRPPPYIRCHGLMERHLGISKGKALSMVGDNCYRRVNDNDDGNAKALVTGNGNSRRGSLLDAIVRLADLPLYSSNRIFIFAFQGGIIHQFSQLSPVLALHFVKFALYRNFGA
jgi:hypothetical protein